MVDGVYIRLLLTLTNINPSMGSNHLKFWNGVISSHMLYNERNYLRSLWFKLIHVSIVKGVPNAMEIRTLN